MPTGRPVCEGRTSESRSQREEGATRVGHAESTRAGERAGEEPAECEAERQRKWERLKETNREKEGVTCPPGSGGLCEEGWGAWAQPVLTQVCTEH